MPKPIQSLESLPCDPEHYLPNIISALHAISAHNAKMTCEEIIENLEQNSKMEENLIRACLRVSYTLGLIEVDNLFLQLSDTGMALAIAGYTEQEALHQSSAFEQLLHYLENWYVGFEEIIYLFGRTLLPSTIGRLGKQPYNVHERVTWLLALGLLKQQAARYKLIYKKTQLLQHDPYVDRPKSLFSHTNPIHQDRFTDVEEGVDLGISDTENIDWLTESDETEKITVEVTQSELDTRVIKPDLKRELREASLDSSNPKRFENAIAEAFKLLGYQVQQFGDKGTTDVVVHATLGDQSHRIIVDAKTHKKPHFYDLKPATLLEHKCHHQADYVVVIARQFSQGKVVRQAETHGIVLLSLDLLELWLDYHDELPASLLTYRMLFEISGELRQLPDGMIEVKQNRIHMINAVNDTIDVLLVGYTKNMIDSWTVEQIYTALNMRYEQAIYSMQEVTIAVEFVCHPMIACAERRDDAVFLLGNKQMLQDGLHKITTLLQLS